ncbi:MAG TPA: hypothetical protein DEB40_07070 [Elusimicrobia bacterium]|nr:hypothetical protein [Elusimicrobiota bacterium]HBT61489.1 hypothetical protein [Elusimicrobiota bacterium]
MPGDRTRHPLFEALVFGLALILGAIILFYGIQRLAGRGPSPGGPSVDRSAEEPRAAAAPGYQTETSVSDIPPIRLSGISRSRGRTEEVPPPAASSDRKR